MPASRRVRKSASSRVAGPLAGPPSADGKGLIWVLALLAAYGSWYPFKFSDPERIGRTWEAFFHDVRVWTSTGDVVGNALLFVPLGVVMAWRLARQGVTSAAWLGWGVAAVAFGLLLQVGQMYLPMRDPALADVLWNGVGVVLGMALGGVMHGTRKRAAGQGSDAAHAALYLLMAWVAVELAPLVPTVDWQNIKSALKPLIGLDLSASKALHALAFAMVCASLLSLGFSNRPGTKSMWLVALLLGSTLARPFLAGKVVTLGWVVGLGLGVVVSAVLLRGAAQRLFRVTLLLLWLSILVDGLAPFQWSAVSVPIDWIPFRSMLRGSMEANFWSLVATVVTAAVFLSLASLWQGMQGFLTLGLIGTVAAVELLQMHVMGRTPDVTPVLLVVLTAWWAPGRLLAAKLA